MPSYETRTQYPILAAFADAEIWTSETTATERDLFAGPAVASVGSALRLVGGGTPTAGSSAIDVKIERGGYPDGSATFQQRVTGAADYASWDAPTEVGYIEPVSWSTSETQSLWSLSSATLPDGRVVLAAEYYSSGTSTIKIRVRSTSGAWSSSATANSSVQAFYRHPQVVATGDGYVRIYFLNHNSKFETTQIAMIEASEDATSATLADFSAFTATQSDLLKSPIPKVGGFYASFLQVAAGGGQVMAIVTQNDTLYQAYSNDGITFTGSDVTISNVRDRAALAYIAGAFLLAYGDVTTGDLKVRSVASAASTLGDADVVTVNSAQYTSGDTDRLVLVRGYDETAWLYSQSDNPSTSTGVGVVYYSGDAGLTWSSAACWRDGQTITAASGCWWRDRTLLFVGANTDLLTYEDSITCLHLGGWTSLPMARRAVAPYEIGARVAMNVAWAPTDKLDHTFAVTTTGTITEAFGADAYLQLSCNAGANSYTAKVTNAAGYPALARLALKVTAGSTDLLVHVDDGTNQYAIKVTVTSTGFTVHDVGAGGTAATVTYTNAGSPHEIFVWASGSSSTVWYREWAFDAPTEWTHVVDETLTSGAYSPLTQIQINGAGGVQTSRIYAFSGYYQSALYGGAFDAFGESVNRDGLQIGAPVSVRPLYADLGFEVAGYSGPARVGDTWALSADSPTPVEMAAWSTDYPSPSDRWKSNTATAEIIAWKFNDAAIAIPPLWALVVVGDVTRITYEWHDGTSWATGATVDTNFVGGFRRRGDTLVPVSGYAVTAGPFVEEDELVGGYCVDSGNRARRITANTSGVLWPSATSKLATITFEGDGTETASTSSWRVVFPRTSAIIHNGTGYAKGFRIKVSPTGYTYTPNGYPDLKVLFGPAVVLGLPHGMDTQIENVGSARSFQAANGRRRSAQAAPMRRVLTLSWQSTLDRLWQVRGDKTTENDPDVILVGSSPVYSRGEAESTIRALVDRWSVTGTPVAYFPRGIDVSAGTSQPARGAKRAGGVVVGTLDALWTVEHGGTGDEQRDDVVRLGALVLTELT